MCISPSNNCRVKKYRTHRFKNFVKIHTGIPRLTRFLWQPKNRVRQNRAMQVKVQKKKFVKKICITRKFYTVKSCYANFFRQAQKTALYKSALQKTALAKGYLYQIPLMYSCSMILNQYLLVEQQQLRQVSEHFSFCYSPSATVSAFNLIEI